MEHPETIGKYRILGRLGRGGMAEVFLARRAGAAGFEKKLALKRLPADQLGDESLVKSLINEARLAAQLSHPNLVQVFEFEFIDGSYCMAMEYIDGVTVEDVLQRCRQLDLPIPNGLIVYMALQVLTGLDYAHTARSDDGVTLNLVHRDIKPSNIMILRQGQIKIMDFGIARAATNVYKTTTSGGVKGTLAYMSPEQLSGADSLGPPSDLFSLGLVLYELVTLDRLLDDQNLLLLARQLMEGLRPDAREQVEARFPALAPILDRMLRPEVADRYDSARSVMTDLHALETSVSAMEMADFIADLSLIATGDGAPGTIPSSDAHQGLLSAPGASSQGASPQPASPGAVTRQESHPGVGMPVDVSGTIPVPAFAASRTRADTGVGPPSHAGVSGTRAAQIVSPRRRWIAFGLAACLVVCGVGAVSWLVFLPRARAPDRGAEGSVATIDAGTTAVVTSPTSPSSRVTAQGAETASPVPSPSPSLSPVEAAGDTRTDTRAAHDAGRKKTRSARRTPTHPSSKMSRSGAGRGAGGPSSPPGAGGEIGFLTVSADPWATVFVDGERIGQSPVKQLRVNSGSHRIRLVGSNGRIKEFDVFVKPGASTTRIWGFTENDWLKYE